MKIFLAVILGFASVAVAQTKPYTSQQYYYLGDCLAPAFGGSAIAKLGFYTAKLDEKSVVKGFTTVTIRVEETGAESNMGAYGMTFKLGKDLESVVATIFWAGSESQVLNIPFGENKKVSGPPGAEVVCSLNNP